MTVGEKSLHKKNKTILLVGETGAGKSTLINALFNYTIGVTWEDEVWFQILEEERNENQTESQTPDVIVYEIFGFEDKTLPYSLTIIDTPGFGDTRGTERDEIVIRRLFQLFGSEDGVHEVHAIGLVMKASDNRLSDRLRQNEERTEEEELGLKFAWQVTEKGMRQFKGFIERTQPQNTRETAEVMKERMRLTACIQNLKERIELAELKQTEIRQIREGLQKHEEEMKRNENFTVEIDEVYKDKQPIDGGMWWLFFYQGAVCCTVCEENCHYPGCTMAWKPEHCEVMSWGRCTVCTNKCPASDHVKEKWRYVTKTRRVQKTEKEMKVKYEKNKSESMNKLSLLQNLEWGMKQLTAEKSLFLDESYKHVVRLEEIALKADSASTIVHLDFLIDKMKERGDKVKAQKLEEIKSREGEGTRSLLHYMFVKIPEAVKHFKK
ncbi:unnamed protein product [Oreochromis niloticus]|nr:unnamed protein product [Mustela putorius furo]